MPFLFLFEEYPMDIGTGIAIAGLWLMVSVCAMSKYVTGFGMLLALVLAAGFTVYLA